MKEFEDLPGILIAKLIMVEVIYETGSRRDGGDLEEERIFLVPSHVGPPYFRYAEQVG